MQTRTKTLLIRVSPDEHDKYLKIARERGTTMSEWVRQLLHTNTKNRRVLKPVLNPDNTFNPKREAQVNKSGDYRARCYGQKTGFTDAEWFAVLDAAQGTCVLCERHVGRTALTMDHIKPLYAGGSHTATNIRAICKSCNIHESSLHMYRNGHHYENGLNKKKNPGQTRLQLFHCGTVKTPKSEVERYAAERRKRK